MGDVRGTVELAGCVEQMQQMLMRPAVLQQILAPWVRVVPLDPVVFPETWEARDYRVGLRLFGVVPMGWQVIGPRHQGALGLIDIGESSLFRVWEHRMTLESLGPKRCRLSDHIRFEARVPDALAGLGLRVLLAYRHRQFAKLLAG